jgi:hypothetical protein
MARAVRHIELTPQTDLRALIREVSNDKIPRVIEEEGRPIAVLAPADHYMRDNAGGAEPTLAHDVLSFYAEMSQRSDVSDLLARLARK